MADIITEQFIQQYKSNLELACQQKESRFMKAVTFEAITGDDSRIKSLMFSRTAQSMTSRHQDVNAVDSVFQERWVTPETIYDAEYLDKRDVLRCAEDPSSSIVMNMAAALERKKDAQIAAAFFGSAKTGVKGGSTTAFDSTNQVVGVQVGGSSTDTGLNLAKLIEARKILDTNEVDTEREAIYCAISAKQHAELLQVTQAVSLDYGTKPVLENGRITSFMGINFIQYQNLPVDSSSFRRIPVWVASGMAFGSLQNLETTITDVPTKVKSTLLKATLDCGATRVDEKKVIEIKCKES